MAGGYAWYTVTVVSAKHARTSRAGRPLAVDG
jgi:hypothetical protein